MKQSLINNYGKFGKIVIIVLIAVIALILLISFVVGPYERIRFGIWPEVSGITPYTDPQGNFYRGKTLWDSLELVIIPVVLLIVGFLFSTSQRKIQDSIAKNRQRDTLLREYFSSMTDLLLEHRLKNTEPGDEVRAVARSLTMTTLRQLDGERKGALLLFLWEAKVLLAPKDEAIDKKNPIIHSDNFDLSEATLTNSFLYGIWLTWANLREADFCNSNLNGADLRGSDLSRARLVKTELMQTDLSETKLREADLRKAKLLEADLRKSDLYEADLRKCDLSYAKFHGANLTGVKLEGAILTKATYADTTVWPKEFDPIQAGATREEFVV